MLESIFFKDTGDADAFDLLSTHWESRYNPFQGLQLSRSVGVESLLFCTNIKSAKGPSSQSYGFSCSHIIWMWEVDHKESWAQKNCWRRRMTPFDWKIKPVNSQGNQSWLFIGRTDAEAETPILWPSDVKNGLTGKGPDAGKDWRQEEKGITEDEMVGWYHQLNGHESGVGDGQRGLASCSPWGCKESDTVEWLNWTELR